MAGVLPGLEDANERKFHLTSGGGVASRLPFFSLSATNNHHQFHFSSHSSAERKVIGRAVCDDERLDAAVREAKKRLDQRLQQTFSKLDIIMSKAKGGEASASAKKRRQKSQGNVQ